MLGIFVLRAPEERFHKTGYYHSFAIFDFRNQTAIFVLGFAIFLLSKNVCNVS